MSKIALTSYSTYSATFLIDAKRYTYEFPNPATVDTIVYLSRKISAAKALAFAKQRGTLIHPVEA